MSERGIFTTGFIYDQRLIPILCDRLSRICRSHTDLRVEGDRIVSGRMHGTYPTEEAFEMELFISDELLPALPAEHGDFQIVVIPEWEEATTMFSIKKGKATKYKLGPPEEMSR